jgi:hypothetical protein
MPASFLANAVMAIGFPRRVATSLAQSTMGSFGRVRHADHAA